MPRVDAVTEARSDRPMSRWISRVRPPCLPRAASRGDRRPIWELVYNHYVNRAGVAAPFSAMYAASVRPEGGGGNYGPNSGGYDQLGYGTLTFTLDPPP